MNACAKGCLLAYEHVAQAPLRACRARCAKCIHCMACVLQHCCTLCCTLCWCLLVDLIHWCCNIALCPVLAPCSLNPPWSFHTAATWLGAVVWLVCIGSLICNTYFSNSNRAEIQGTCTAFKFSASPFRCSIALAWHQHLPKAVIQIACMWQLPCTIEYTRECCITHRFQK